jgi:hypothetical protein
MNTLSFAGCTGMVKTIEVVSAMLSLGILVSACDGTGTLPTAATPTPPAPTAAIPTVTPTYNLSGVVFEIAAAGLAPVEGAEVYCDSCGSADGHTWVYTDANGFYSLDWTSNGVHPLFVTKDGYRHPNGASLDDHGRIRATVNGDTRFDVELVRR